MVIQAVGKQTDSLFCNAMCLIIFLSARSTVFKERVRKIAKTDKHLAEYLRKTRPISVKCAHLTERGDPQAMLLPVIKSNIITKTDTVIYNRINKCGSSTLLSTYFPS